ncbi:uncharacterized protein LOC116128238 isoform X1 [Pistacia vera]|uniref:uncharacterized protein LOC116128238 isoform X1 n=1 Tax=Pistacia vera TaxID=55513 RepID=UPI00126333AC|nr:uncharacterized protein LOC116128238 isoform X1 [Pistacia vera]
MINTNSFHLSKSNLSHEFLIKYYSSASRVSMRALSSTSASEQTSSENVAPMAKAEDDEMEFSRVNCLVWVLHESARSFSRSVESLGLAGSGAELSMAWNGKDVNEWHKRIAYRVVVYALLKVAIEVEILLSHDRHNNAAPVNDILAPKINAMREYIESQLSIRHSELVQWFRIVELPRIEGFFSSLLKKWSMEYAGSGVAGIIVAISCCAAVGKLGPERIVCPTFKMSIEDVSVELMNISGSFVPVDKLHQLATEAGFEPDFLSHFGKKVLLDKNTEELEFWIGLAQKKLSIAFYREGLLCGTKNLHEKVQADSLANLGLFAYLGRMTRLFLSSKGIKDVDEMVKDFLSYLECGILFIYPEFSSISVYQHFMEIVTDEIGWLDFYAAFPSMCNQERRSKHHAIQAEKEIILSNVFAVCYDVFSGFAHFSRSTQQTLDAELLAFLLRSQSLLTICLDDYWAAYDRSSTGLLKIAETGASDHIPTVGTKGTTRLSAPQEGKQRRYELLTHRNMENKSQHPSNVRKAMSSAEAGAIDFMEDTSSGKTNSMQESLVRKYSIKLMSTSSDVWMGTQLLFIDISMSLELLLKQLHGYKVTMRERKKLKRTLNDIATLIPITILMLLPVSAVGHAAMLAAIKKYMPSMIPSPYSSERLDVVKQLERTKKMEVQSWGNLEDPSTMS